MCICGVYVLYVCEGVCVWCVWYMWYVSVWDMSVGCIYVCLSVALISSNYVESSENHDNYLPCSWLQP